MKFSCNFNKTSFAWREDSLFSIRVQSLILYEQTMRTISESFKSSFLLVGGDIEFMWQDNLAVSVCFILILYVGFAVSSVLEVLIRAV